MCRKFFNLKCLSIEFFIQNPSQIYFYIQERLNRFSGAKSPFKFVFFSCESTKVDLYSKSRCEMSILKLSGMQKSLTCFPHIYVLCFFMFYVVIKGSVSGIHIFFLYKNINNTLFIKQDFKNNI